MAYKIPGIRTIAGTLIVAFAALTAHQVQAELVATPLRGDSRLVQFNYDADNTYLILAKPKAVTHVQFAAEELIQSVAAGDTANWELTPTKNRKNLFVKPKYDDLETSMTVITDKRTYQFVLRSTGEGKKWYQRVNWIYSSDMLLAVEGNGEEQTPAATSSDKKSGSPLPRASATDIPSGGLAVQPEALRFTYEITGDAPFRPLVVFDDGRFTYFKLASSLQELPALFAVIEGNEYSLVNFEVRGDYLVAQRVLEKAVLKLGKAEVRVSLAQPRRGLFGFRAEN
jgi:type IV secretion system protein VirB9